MSVILFDDLHTAPQHDVAAQSIATRLMERWTVPGDLLAVRQVSDPRPSFTLTPDPRGLVSTEGDVVEIGGASSANRGVADALSVAAQRLSLSRLSLRHLAEETGGFASINSNDFTNALARIGHETSHYYLLGFYPADASCQHGTRKLRVKVHRPNLRVVARGSYSCSVACSASGRCTG